MGIINDNCCGPYGRDDGEWIIILIIIAIIILFFFNNGSR
jgi:hypothetical protein